jgi:hypothetical protein
LSLVRDALLPVGVEISADELPLLPNHVRATGQRIGCKCPIAENERDREHDSQHDSRQHRFHRKSSSLSPAHFLERGCQKCAVSAATSVTELCFASIELNTFGICVARRRAALLSTRIRKVHCPMRRWKLLVLMYRPRPAVAYPRTKAEAAFLQSFCGTSHIRDLLMPIGTIRRRSTG